MKGRGGGGGGDGGAKCLRGIGPVIIKPTICNGHLPNPWVQHWQEGDWVVGRRGGESPKNSRFGSKERLILFRSEENCLKRTQRQRKRRRRAKRRQSNRNHRLPRQTRRQNGGG